MDGQTSWQIFNCTIPKRYIDKVYIISKNEVSCEKFDYYLNVGDVSTQMGQSAMTKAANMITCAAAALPALTY